MSRRELFALRMLSLLIIVNFIDNRGIATVITVLGTLVILIADSEEANLNKKEEVFNMKTVEQQKTEIRTERAIKFLEQGVYKLAEKEVELILSDSNNLQDRMAAMAIEYVCNRKDIAVTKHFLETVKEAREN